MKRLLISGLYLTVLLLGACRQPPDVSPQQSFLPEFPKISLLIRNGEILDGLGNAPFPADVVVVDDEIVFVGESTFTEADLNSRITRVIDAEGRTVAPGFIDLHSHGNPLETPEFENFLAMGVTTITLGQDGSSPDVPHLGTWLAEVEQTEIGVNLAMFVGHGTLRSQSGIGRTRVPSPEQLQTMLNTLSEALTYSFGLSTGLEYNPGLNAETAELLALAEVVGQADRMIMSHIRNEDDDSIGASIQELLAQGKFARVHVSHLKSVFGRGTTRADEILQLLKQARNDGISVTADLYPYNASYTGISIVFPVWAKTLEQFQEARLNRRGELEEYLRNRVNRRNGPEATLLGTSPYTGKTLADLSRELEMPFEQVLIENIGPEGSDGAYFVMDDELQAQLLASPDISICSDGSPTGFHPRGHGTFAKIIEEYVVKRKVLSLPEAVRKMTSQAAVMLGIHDRGILIVGQKADLIVFDESQVKARATYPNPHQLAEGFDIVIVNGKIARLGGRLATMSSGRVLKPARGNSI